MRSLDVRAQQHRTDIIYLSFSTDAFVAYDHDVSLIVFTLHKYFSFEDYH